MRRKCQACRLKKCKAVGMRQECVVPEVQCAMKRESKRAQKDKDKPQSTTRDTPNGNGMRHNNNLTDNNGNSQTTPVAQFNQQHTTALPQQQQPAPNQTPPQPSGIGMTQANLHHTIPTTISTHQPGYHIATMPNTLTQQPASNPTPPQPSSIAMTQASLHHTIPTTISAHSQSYHLATMPSSLPQQPAPNQTPPQPSSIALTPASLHHSIPTTISAHQPSFHVATNGRENQPSLHPTNVVAATNLPTTLTQHSLTLPVINPNLSMEQIAYERARDYIQKNMYVIEELVQLQDEYESPREEDINSVPPYKEGESDNQFKHFAEMTKLTVRLIVEFAKKVRGFTSLTREDQITLLKASASEVMMLRSTRKYDIKTDSILFANNQPFTRENYRKAHIGEIADAMFNFCRSTVILRLDQAQYALITALILFSERPGLNEPEKVESIQDYYLEIMQNYVEYREQYDKCKFARLLSLLPELRALGIVNSDVCFSLKIKQQRLPDFLAEIWDVKQEEEEVGE